jgi:hypothetical protein
LATDAATETAGESATGTRDAGQGLVEAKGKAGSLWRGPGRAGEPKPGDDDEGFAEPEAGDARRDRTNGGAASKLVDGKFQEEVDDDRGGVEDLQGVVF